MTDFVISVDLETLGLDDSAEIIQVGAALFRLSGRIGHIFARIEFYVWQDKFNDVEPYAAAMNADILYAIASVKMGHATDVVKVNDGDYPGIYVKHTYVISYLNNWLRQFEGNFEDGKFVFTGKNFGSFDLPKLKAQPGVLARSQHRYIDPGILYWQPEIDGAVLPDTRTCMERAGMDPQVEHTALADAIVVAQLVQTWSQGNVNVVSSLVRVPEIA